MLSSNQSHINSIDFEKCGFDKSSNENKTGIEELLQKVPADLILVDNLKFHKCNLTDGIFIPIVGFLKFVKSVIFENNNLTCESLYAIIKVS